jgi:hypothetical protein
MSDVGRALEQIAEIHEHLAKSEIYRGWRSIPVACSGLVGLVAAGSQPVLDARGFTFYWVGIGTLALLVGCSEIAWHFAMRATATERRRSSQVLGQFLPALVAGALVTGALLQFGPEFVRLLPGLWALFFGVGIFAARPYVPRASGWVALYYWTTGLLLLWGSGEVNVLSPWAVGGTFGAGQLLGAAVLYWNLERGTREPASREYK